MSKPVLAYWDVRCLAESIRLMLEYLGIDFVDKRYPTGDPPNYDREEWMKDKSSLGFDFPNVPYWIDGNVKLTQSWAIMRHIARRNHRLYPENMVEEQKCDVLQGFLKDFRYRFIYMCYTKNKQEFELHFEKYCVSLPADLSNIEKFIGDNKWLIGEKLTYVDFVLCETLDQIRLFMPNFLKNNNVLKQYLQRFDELESIIAYRSSDRYHAFPINSKYYFWGGTPYIQQQYSLTTV